MSRARTTAARIDTATQLFRLVEVANPARSLPGDHRLGDLREAVGDLIDALDTLEHDLEELVPEDGPDPDPDPVALRTARRAVRTSAEAATEALRAFGLTVPR